VSDAIVEHVQPVLARNHQFKVVNDDNHGRSLVSVRGGAEFRRILFSFGVANSPQKISDDLFLSPWPLKVSQKSKTLSALGRA
jgi:hypothetical protein